jgi:hypothetical protein
VAGRLKFHVSEWEQLTSYPFVLQTVTGCYIDFASIPVQSQISKEIQFSLQELSIITEEVRNLVVKGVIVPSHHEPGEYIYLH